MVCIVKKRAILVLPLLRPGHLEKASLFLGVWLSPNWTLAIRRRLQAGLPMVPLSRPSPPRKSCAFPRCLAFAKLDTRNKEALTSKLAYGSAVPSRHLEKAALFLGVWLSPNWTLAIRRRLQASLQRLLITPVQPGLNAPACFQ